MGEWSKRPSKKLPKWFGERPGKKKGEPETPEGEEGEEAAPAEDDYEEEEEEEEYDEEEESAINLSNPSITSHHLVLNILPSYWSIFHQFLITNQPRLKTYPYSLYTVWLCIFSRATIEK